MHRTFNNGIGMVLIVPERDVEDIMVRLSGLKETAYIIGEISKAGEDETSIELI